MGSSVTVLKAGDRVALEVRRYSSTKSFCLSRPALTHHSYSPVFAAAGVSSVKAESVS